MSKDWNYRSVADLNTTIINWMGELPDFDLIVGIPRSGMLAASLLSLHLNLPLTDIDHLFEEWEGTTKPHRITSHGKALVLDDSLYSGRALQEAHMKADLQDLPFQVWYGAVYVVPGAEEWVDFHAEIVPNPRFFEWNLMHYEEILKKTCMDIDGVLCRDPSRNENDGDGPNYQRFLGEACRYYLPSAPVGWLVTARLERYRAQTEEWLARHGVQYGELLMMNYETSEERQWANPWPWGSYKAEIYESTGAELFIESDRELSEDIARLTDKPVFCMETRELL